MIEFSSNTYTDIRKVFQRNLIELYPTVEIDSILHIVLEYYTGKSRKDFLLNPGYRFEESLLIFFHKAMRRLQKAVPVQYITGEAWFMNEKYYVNPDVLIPRPETEELVDMVLKRKGNSFTGAILDIGTGSGCIAISLAKGLKSKDIYAIDISEKSLAVAAHNADRLSVSIHFIKEDILTSDINLFKEASFGLIISNPPYVCESEKKLMHDNVLNNEPHQALFVKDDNPLVFYETIAKKASKWLEPGGNLIFEINERYGNQLLQLLEGIGYSSVELIKDFNQKDRFVWATMHP